MQRFSHTMQRLSWVAGVMVVACGLVGLLFMTPGRVSAQAGGGETAVVPDAPALPATAPGLLEFMQTEPADSHVASPDLACAMCHGDTTAEIEFPSGETLPVRITSTSFMMCAGEKKCRPTTRAGLPTDFAISLMSR